MYDVRQLRKGLRIEIEGIPYQVVDFQHVSPGKGSAFTRTKLRNLLNDNQIERTFRSGEKLAVANTDQKDMQYLYKDSQGFHFMDMANYEQVILTQDILGEATGFLQANTEVKVMFYQDRAIGVDLPNFVQLRVAQTDPAFKGDTVSGGTKPATLETGAVVQVPFHIKEGDVLKIDTRSATYVEKAK